MTAADLRRGGRVAHRNRSRRLCRTDRRRRDGTRQIGLCIWGEGRISQGTRTAPARTLAALTLAPLTLAPLTLAACALAARILATSTLNRVQPLTAISRTAGTGLARQRFAARRLGRLDRTFGRRCCAHHVIGHGLGHCIASGNRRVFGLGIH